MVKLLATLALASSAFALRIQDSTWEAYKTKFNKSYSEAEDIKRYATFKEQLEIIAAHNERADAGLEKFWMGQTWNTDHTTEEVKKLRNGYKAQEKTSRSVGAQQYPCPYNFSPGSTPPTNKNWVSEGAVTVVKNQMYCGDCWAFSAAACMEGAMFMAGHQIHSLSAQQITDCASSNRTLGPYSNDGCNGGFPQSAFYYAMTNGGVETYLQYPFVDMQQACEYNADYSVASFSDCVDVTNNGLANNEQTLQYASAQIGPISIAIDAGLNSFHNYAYGIYEANACNPNSLDHAVTLVGYGTVPAISASITTNCVLDDFYCTTIQEGIQFQYPCMSVPTVAPPLKTPRTSPVSTAMRQARGPEKTFGW